VASLNEIISISGNYVHKWITKFYNLEFCPASSLYIYTYEVTWDWRILHNEELHNLNSSPNIIKKIGIVGCGVHLGPLTTAATNRSIVPAPGDYDDGEIGGMVIGRGNRSTRRKPAPVPLCPPQTPHALLGREPGPPRWEASDWPLELRHSSGL
jgi:hypothetical protein